MTDLNQLRAELAAERAARARAEADLEAARGDAIARSRFLASMEHTLRTPLNGVVGYTDVLLEEAFGTLNDRQRRYAQRIAGGGHRQLEFITNLMTLSLLHAGDLELVLHPIRVADLVNASVSALRSTAEQKGLALVVHADTDAIVHGDTEYLQEAVRHVLHNAIRYSDQPGEVSVIVREGLGDEGGDGTTGCVTVVVSDHGPGVAPDQLPFILDDLDRCERRPGLGLPLARRIVELHGGRIQVESEGRPGAGTRVSIVLSTGPPGGPT